MGYDYIGYGLSEQKSPSEQLCYDSMEATMNYLMNEMKISPKNIFLMGQSLGTGITVDYIYKYEWSNPVILISPYKSICKVVYDTSLVSPIDKYKTLEKLKKIYCPIKIFHGDADDVININHGMTLYKNLNNKSLSPVWLKNIGHNNILDAIEKEHLMEVLNYDTDNKN